MCSYVLKLLRLETTITFSDATLSDINVVLCYVLLQYRLTCPTPQQMILLYIPKYNTKEILAGGTYVENPDKIQHPSRLACHMVRAPNTYSGGHEFE
jgi:hypothetical protein